MKHENYISHSTMRRLLALANTPFYTLRANDKTFPKSHSIPGETDAKYRTGVYDRTEALNYARDYWQKRAARYADLQSQAATLADTLSQAAAISDKADSDALLTRAIESKGGKNV